MSDAVVVGAGPNGLVAANVLADAGWSVAVVEANDAPGGAVRSAEVTAPGYVNDLFSAFYPLGAASPVLRELGLEQYGLTWSRAPKVLAHPSPGGPAAVLSMDVDETAASLDAFAPGDGNAWRSLFDLWQRVSEPMLDALLRPFPPVRAAGRLLWYTGGAGNALDLARLSVVPVRRIAEERFRGPGGGLVLAGCALHADLTPESSLGSLFGLVLAGLGQQIGWPVPTGGAQRLTDALVRRLEARGGAVVCGARVTSVEIRDRRAVGVRTADGRDFPASRAVLADVSAPALYLRLVGPQHLSRRMVAAVNRFEHGAATVKVDWALSGPIPWKDPAVSDAGTVHVADSMEELSVTAMQLATGYVPARPFLLVGQMTTADPTRSPEGTESAWAYTHVPHKVRGDAGGDDIDGAWNDSDAERFVDRLEERVESYAPGFRSLVVARHVLTPPALEAADANLVGGDVGGGTAQLHQQLVFRPVPGLGRAETPIRGLYLASASAHPGGGVHGACGANAARAALAHDRLRAARNWTVSRVARR
jgi:phytoene dehydrogenase-like protein